MSDELEMVFTTTHLTEALIIQSALESEGIFADVENEHQAACATVSHFLPPNRCANEKPLFGTVSTIL